MARILPTFAKDSAGRAPVPDPDAARVGVIDIGSNSIRLVVYEGARRAPVPIFNEKVLCGIGSKLQSTGRLDPDGVDLALQNIPRFVAAADAMEVEELHVVATAAARDAEDGPDFIAAIERDCGVAVRVITGEEEARLAGFGVLSSHPEAEGVVGDLGGGSLELARLDNGRLGEHVTLPLGPLRLNESGLEGKALKKYVDEALDAAPWLGRKAGGAFYAVGGAWRALARIHLAQTRHKLHVIDGYKCNATDFGAFAKLISRQRPERLTQLENVPSRRLETLPVAALVLRRLLKRTSPHDLIFSATGLREGVLHDALPAEARGEDPLIAAAGHYSARFTRFQNLGDALFEWTSPLFPAERPRAARLRHATCLMADIGWAEHPDYRARHTFRRIVALPLFGLDHAGRAFIARSIYARYGGDARWGDKRSVALGLDPDDVPNAQLLGAALRLGFTLCVGQAGVLRASELRLGKDQLTLIAPSWGSLAKGEAVKSRFEGLASAAGLQANLVLAGPAAR